MKTFSHFIFRILVSLTLPTLFWLPEAIAQNPTITDISPISGQPKSQITIKGINYDDKTFINAVFFGTIQANINKVTSTSLVVDVPLGASYGRIWLQTYPGGKNPFYVEGMNAFDVTDGSSGCVMTPLTFLPGVDFKVGSSSTKNGIAKGDLDGDGLEEIVTIENGSNVVSILPNLSSGGKLQFGSELTFGANSSTMTDLAIADLNGDQLPDLIFADSKSTTISYCLNLSSKGSIKFDKVFSVTPLSGAEPYALAVADIDVDGQIDVVIANRSSAKITILFNQSSLTTISFRPFTPSIDMSGSPASVTVADIDADGREDIITANSTANTISIIPNRSTPNSPNFGASVSFSTGSGSNPTTVVAGDLNGDLLMDVAVGCIGKGTVVTFDNDTKGSLINPTAFNLNSNVPVDIDLGDMNGDGKPDIVAASQTASGTNSLSVFMNLNKTPGQGASFDKPVDYSTGKGQLNKLALGDFNQDATTDVAFGYLLSSPDLGPIITIFQKDLQLSAPSVSISGPSSLCVGQTVSFTATALSNVDYSWSVPTGCTIIAGVGTNTISVTVGSTTGAGTVTVTPLNACNYGSSATFPVTVIQTPTITATTPASRCGTGPVVLGGTASAGIISWYNTLGGGTALATGNSFTTPSISTNTTYYIETTQGTCTSSPRTAVVATVNTAPTITGTTPSSRCGSGIVVLGAAASAGTISWYTTLTGGTALATGTSYTTPSISASTTYYVDATLSGCTTSPRVSVTATITSAPTITGSTPGFTCGPGTVILSASSPGTISWYSTLTGGTPLGTGPSFTTPSISSNTTYYAEATLTGCVSASRTGVLASVNSIPTITGTTPGSVCGSGTVTLSATSSGGAISWFSTLTGGTALGTGASFTTPSLSSNTTYYMEATQSGCTSTSRTAVLATVNTFPAITSTTPASVCGSGTVTLGATSSAGTISWFSTLTGGTALGSGTSFTTPSLSANTTYYVEATQTGCTTTSRTSVTASVNAIPTITSTTPGARCGSGTVSLAAIASAGTISWFSTLTGGTALGTGASFTTPSLSSNTTYYVEATQSGCTSTSRTAVLATVNTIPTITSTTPASVCGSGTVTLGATSSSGTISWFSTLTGGTALGSGTSYTTPSLSSNTTYYVEATQSGCTSTSRSAVLATVITIPTITGTTPASICGSGTIILSATSSGGIISWFTTLTGGTALGTGTSFTTPSLSANTTYYVEATQSGCTSTSRTAVLATVNTIPTITSTTPGTRCGSGTVSLAATASAGTISWFATLTGGTALATANNYTTPVIGANTTYYVEATQSGCTTSSRVSVTAIVNTTPSITGTTPASICGSGTLTLGASSSAGTISWFSASTGGTSLGSGTSFNTGVLSSSVTYYVEASASGCTSAPRISVLANVNPYPTITSTTPGTRCGSGTVVLAAASSGGTISWFSTLTGGTALGTGPSFTTPSLSANATYYVEATQAGCTTTSRTSVTATVNSIPTITGTTPTSRCGSGTLILSATSSAGIISWFSNLTGGTALGSGPSFTTPALSSTTTYYAEATQTGCTSTSRTSVVATVNLLPTVSVPSDFSVCANVNSANVTSTINNATGVVWTSTGNGSFIPNNTATNPTYTITSSDKSFGSVVLTATTTGPCTAASKSVSITITPLTTANAGTDISACKGGGAITLTGSATNAVTTTWTSSGNGTFLNASNPSASYTPSLADEASGQTQLFLTATSSLCATAKDTLVITYTTATVIDAGADASVCANGTIKLNASGASGTWSGGSGTYSPNSTASNAIYTPTASEISAGSLTLTISSFPGLCPVVFDQVTFTFKSAPAANPVAAVSLCSGTSTNINLTSTPIGASFDWTVSPVSGSVTGATSGSGTSINQTLINNGVINYNVTPTLNLCAGPTITIPVTVNIPVIAPATLATGTVGIAYSQTFSVSNMSSPVWSSANLPATFSLSSSGLLNAASSSNTNYNFDITAFNTGGCSVTKTYNLNFIIKSTTWDGNSWSNGVPNAAIDAIINGNYSTTASEIFSANNITISSGTTFTINGTATVTAATNLINNGIIKQQCTSNLTYANVAGAGTVQIISPQITPATLPIGLIGSPYSQTTPFAVSFGISPTFSIFGLPNGMQLSGNVITGTPSQVGNFSLTISSTDGSCSSTNTLSLLINGLKDPNLSFAQNSLLKTYGDAPFTIPVTSASNAPLVYQSSNSCLTVDANGEITIHCASSNVLIIASQTSTGNYKAVADTVSIIIDKAKLRPTLLTLPGLIIGTNEKFDYLLPNGYSNPLVSYNIKSGSSFAALTGDTIVPIAAGPFEIELLLPATTNYKTLDTIYQFTVFAVAQPPKAVSDTMIVIRKNGIFSDASINLLQNDFGTTNHIKSIFTDIDTINPGTQTIFYSPKIGTFEFDPITGVLTIHPIKGLNSTTRIGYTITDSSGLTSSIAYVVIEIENKQDLPDLRANEVMTPNNDGHNDALFIGYTDTNKKNKIEIIDEAGNTVYKTQNYQNNWLGTDQKGNILEAGVYYFVFNEEEDLNRELKGYIEIIRRGE